MPKVALLVTCLVDLFRPQAAFAALRLLEKAGVTVIVPSQQTCCGQPAYNSGDRKTARKIARQVIASFEPFDHVVVPSGSCAGMLVKHYPDLFEVADPYRARATELSGKTRELTQYLVEIGAVAQVDAAHDGTVAFHDSCSALREMNAVDQPRRLLRAVRGLDLRDLADPAACCGFGGTFCVKYPEISNDMVTRKAADVSATGAATLTSCDLGCLLNIAGKLARDGSSIRCFHIAEILAGTADDPAIGEATAGAKAGSG